LLKVAFVAIPEFESRKLEDKAEQLETLLNERLVKLQQQKRYIKFIKPIFNEKGMPFLFLISHAKWKQKENEEGQGESSK